MAVSCFFGVSSATVEDDRVRFRVEVLDAPGASTKAGSPPIRIVTLIVFPSPSTAVRISCLLALTACLEEERGDLRPDVEDGVDLLPRFADSFLVAGLPLLEVGRLRARPRRLDLVDPLAEAAAAVSVLVSFPEAVAVLLRVELRNDEFSPAVDCELLRRLVGRPPAGDISVMCCLLLVTSAVCSF